MLLELRGAEACAGEAEDVAGEGQQRAVLAEARVQAHAQGQEDLPELFVCQGRELLVVVKGEVYVISESKKKVREVRFRGRFMEL